MEGDSKHPTLGNGKICYLEIPAIDVNRSAEFYKNVFSWTIRRHNDGSIAFDDGVNEVSGTWVLNRQPISQGSLIVYLMVDSVAETVEKIEINSGKVVKPPGGEGPEVTAQFTDPAGNVFGIFQQ